MSASGVVALPLFHLVDTPAPAHTIVRRLPKTALPPRPARGWGGLTSYGEPLRQYSETVEARPPMFINVDHHGLRWAEVNWLYWEWSSRAYFHILKQTHEGVSDE